MGTTMNVRLGAAGALAGERAQLVGLLLRSDDLSPDWLPAWLANAVRPPIAAKDFTGRELETALVWDGSAGAGRRARRVLLVGLGAGKKLKLETLRRAAGSVSRRARTLKLDGLALALAPSPLDPADAGRSAGEGIVLGGYAFHGLKTEPAPRALRKATVHVHASVRETRAFGKGLRAGAASASAQCFARDLGNQPANVATPTWLAAQARRLARGSALRVKAVRGRELERRRFGGLLGVARGSSEPPVFLELEWRPRHFRRTVCLIGKGLTFDSGGISLKPAQNMEEMKFDMCGGAAVLGAFQAIARTRPGVRVLGLVPCSENMPSGSAMKPGDVLKSYGGISIEVVNTDAEGRLLLADALGRARELKADYTIDLATLTGACVVALGHRATGLFCNHDDLGERLRKAGDATGERLWPLPLWDEYLEDMKSAVADVKNSGPRFGGAVTAAAFLRKFAGDLAWAHLDIAGTAWDVPKTELYEAGASGVGVRTLLRFIEGLN